MSRETKPGSPCARFRVQVRQGVVFRKVGGQHVLLDLQSGDFYSLNETGTEMWDLLNQGLSSEEVVQRMVEMYAVADEAASADLRELVGELERKGLVRVQAEA